MRVRRHCAPRLIAAGHCGPVRGPGASRELVRRTPLSVRCSVWKGIESTRMHAGRRDLVVIGASAGGVEVLMRVVQGLPADLRRGDLHRAPHRARQPQHARAHPGSGGTLPCRSAQDGERLRRGVILVAPPDHHLAIEDGHVRVTVGPRENGHRPSIDVLFRSAAAALDSRVVGVVLSGTRDDGSAGLAVIKASGGATIVQDPNEAMYAGMPASAIANVAVDAIVPSELVASTIAAMVNGEDPPPGASSDDPDPDPPAASRSTRSVPNAEGCSPSGARPACCSGNAPSGIVTPPTRLIDAQADSVEAALWAAIRALADRGVLLGRMAQQAEQRGQPDQRAGSAGRRSLPPTRPR